MDAETGELISGIQSIEIHIDVNDPVISATMKMVKPELDIEAETATNYC